MPLYAIDDHEPVCGGSVWLAPTASVMGRVQLADRVNVWFGAVIRGDNEPISVGEGTNIQDLAMLHSDWGAPLSIGANCTIGHGAIIHGCTIEDGSLIGMGATVLNGAKIGRGSIVGANALVPENRDIAPGSLVVGMPAKVVRSLDQATMDGLRAQAAGYVKNAVRFAAGLRRLDAGPGV